MDANKIYALTKQTIARVKGRDPRDIRASQRLAEDLNFTLLGKRGLSQDLNETFRDNGTPIPPQNHGLHPDETVGATTVRDLMLMIDEHFSVSQ